MMKWLLFPCIILLGSSSALADTICLGSGAEKECVIIKETESAVTFRTKLGTLKVGKDMIERIERATAEENEELLAKWAEEEASRPKAVKRRKSKRKDKPSPADEGQLSSICGTITMTPVDSIRVEEAAIATVMLLPGTIEREKETRGLRFGSNLDTLKICLDNCDRLLKMIGPRTSAAQRDAIRRNVEGRRRNCHQVYEREYMQIKKGIKEMYEEEALDVVTSGPGGKYCFNNVPPTRDDPSFFVAAFTDRAGREYNRIDTVNLKPGQDRVVNLNLQNHTQPKDWAVVREDCPYYGWDR